MKNYTVNITRDWRFDTYFEHHVRVGWGLPDIRLNFVGATLAKFELIRVEKLE